MRYNDERTVTVFVAPEDLFEASGEINPECPVEWLAEGGTKVILRVAICGEELDRE
ncbi:hypothetical protein [Streptomyces sp. T028]|uniref:hypothetical protein n=1 Tax=Streptomyces sp. T028 TaxID=3394379 RepID=UPI003A890EFA